MHPTLSSIPKQRSLGTALCDTCMKWALLRMEDRSESGSVPGPSSALASASACSTQDEYAETDDSDEASEQNDIKS